MKVLLSGAAVSLVSGLLLGGALHPRLDVADAKPSGPQTLIVPSGSRLADPSEESAVIGGRASSAPGYAPGAALTYPTAPPVETVTSQSLAEPPKRTEEPASVARAPAEARRHPYPSMQGDYPSVIEIDPPEPADDEAPW